MINPAALDLSRTRKALVHYDAAAERLDMWTASRSTDLFLLVDDLERARVAVGDAFAADTADRNDAATARSVVYLRPSDWLRRLVAEGK